MIFRNPFYLDSEIREKETIKHLLNTTPLIWNFAGGGSILWIAINIPLEHYSEGNIKGDIDLAVSANFHIGNGQFKNVVRVFEIKVNILDLSGRAKSLKTGKKKITKIKDQLDKLREFGCENIFFCDISCAEPPSEQADYPHPLSLGKLVKNRISLLRNTNYGYAMFYMQSINARYGRINQDPTVLLSHDLPRGNYFIKFIKAMDKIAKSFVPAKSFNKRGLPTIIYCQKCKKYYCLSHKVELDCPHCHRLRNFIYRFKDVLNKIKAH